METIRLPRPFPWIDFTKMWRAVTRCPWPMFQHPTVGIRLDADELKSWGFPDASAHVRKFGYRTN